MKPSRTIPERGLVFLGIAVAVLIIVGAVLWFVQPRPLTFVQEPGHQLGNVTVVDNQVSPAQLSPDAIRAAVASYGLTYAAGGASACGQGRSPSGVAVICVQAPPCRCWAFTYILGGIVLSPMLVGQPTWKTQEAACHEIGNALGYPEEPPGAHDCMALSMNGSTNPPGGR